MLFCAGLAGTAYSQDALSSIDEIEIKAQERGIILIISGSGPIAVGGNPDQLEKATSQYSEVRVNIKNAVSKLGASSFSGPQELAVREIFLKENPGSVDLIVKMRNVMNGPVLVRGSGNQIRILLTKDAQPEINWLASKTTASGSHSQRPVNVPEPEKAVLQTKLVEAGAAGIPEVSVPGAAERTLGNIRVVQRDKTASLYFDLSAASDASVNKGGDSLVIRFSNTSSKLPPRVYNIPGSTVYNSVRIRNERGADRSSAVVAVVKLNQRGGALSPVTMPLDNQYAVYTSSYDSARVFLWNAIDGVQSSFSFTQIGAEPVDMQKMEKRAAQEIEKPIGAGALFPIRDEPEKSSGGKVSGSANTAFTPTPERLPRIAPPKTEVPVANLDEVVSDNSSLHDGEAVRESGDGEQLRYKVYGRDPFVPLMREEKSFSDLPKVENLKLVGILEDSRERIALLEDSKNQNRAFAMRADDMVEYGKVLRVHRDRVIFLMSDIGVSYPYTIRLESPGTKKR
ncbi:MAG: hypothetical protein LBI42_12315 [Chitinispirillales bacterium]|nr:hypothetical protein [Chitinispirillales bacterium]